jgi:Tfp pilus assembly protein PilF
MRGMAVGSLALVSLLMVFEARALRGELAFARFCYLARMTDRAGKAVGLASTVSSACQEAELVKTLAPHNSDEQGEVASIMLGWTLDGRLPRELRTRIAAKAIESATVSVRGAPSDYLTWLELARTYFTLGMWDQAEVALKQARSLVRHRRQVRMFGAPTDE